MKDNINANLMNQDEQEEYDKLRFGFHIIKEDFDFNKTASKRVAVARPLATKLLRLSFYLNVASLICFTLALVITLLKPAPNYYGATPNGKIYLLKTTKSPR